MTVLYYFILQLNHVLAENSKGSELPKSATGYDPQPINPPPVLQTCFPKTYLILSYQLLCLPRSNIPQVSSP